MKKVFSLKVSFFLLLLMLGSIVPSGVSVYASDNYTEEVYVDLKSEESFDEEQVEQLVVEISKNYPELSKEYLRDGVYKQLRGDYTIDPISTDQGVYITDPSLALRSPWQGITVNQMGAFIDTAIGIAIGGAIGGLAAAMKKVGKHAAISAVKAALIKYGMVGGFITQNVIDFVFNLNSPGAYLAKYWDQRDKVPNNGRINF
ncbi:hypothetical protein [Candidatus Enterococcus mangumiae]|uniref:Glycine zipper family protein n=2 Tax=Enterococcus TaxID=1350 RepID=A0ABZ2SSA6_9ENTE|nr:hypothetical protein [Enterococcus sp. DIV1094]MBO0488781.1 hypothetical protein [Enterococcus sp. DIV1094]